MSPEEDRSRFRVVVVDDESPARALVREFLSAYPDVEVVAECANGLEAVEAIAEKKPAVVFLDVQMPGLSGFEVVDLIAPEIAVVFTTAFDRFALRAFEVHAVDYLLKPFSAERFAQALERARARVSSNAPRPGAGELARAARAAGEWLGRIVVRDGSRALVIPVGELDAVQAQDDYVALRWNGREILKQQTLASLESSLDPSRFVRVHRSWIVNVDRVTAIESAASGSREALLADQTRVPVSRAGHERLREAIEGQTKPG